MGLENKMREKMMADWNMDGWLLPFLENPTIDDRKELEHDSIKFCASKVFLGRKKFLLEQFFSSKSG